jgi:hypothetical protein
MSGEFHVPSASPTGQYVSVRISLDAVWALGYLRTWCSWEKSLYMNGITYKFTDHPTYSQVTLLTEPPKFSVNLWHLYTSILELWRNVIFPVLIRSEEGARDSVVGWGTMLQAGRSRSRFPISSLEFLIDLISPTALWPWGRLSL